MATKAAEAARKQRKANTRPAFDKSKLEVLFESDPVPVSPRFGVLSVQVYSYDGGSPRIGIYRVWVSGKTNEERTTKETCPIDAAQASMLADALTAAANYLVTLGT